MNLLNKFHKLLKIRQGFVLVAVCFFSAFSLGNVQSAPEIQLTDNVFVVPDPNAKAINFWMIIKAGCQDEAHGHCHGLAHYLEHLTFLGRNSDHTATVGRFFPDALTNAYTSRLSTVYWQQFAKRSTAQAQNDDLEKLFHFYSGQLQELNVSDAEAERERGVVLQEYNMRYAASPLARYLVKLEALLYPRHPRGQKVIGTKEEIESLTLAEAREFHQKWYSRNNAIFVVHGPVDVDVVKALAEKYVTTLPDRPVPQRDWLIARLDTAPAGLSETVEDKAAISRYVSVQKLMSFEEADHSRALAAIWIINNFLRSGLSNSPSDKFIEQDSLAEELSRACFIDIAPGVAEFDLWLKSKPGNSDEQILSAMKSYMASLADTGLSESTVERLKKRIIEALAQEAKDPQSTADALVDWLSIHEDYKDFQARNDVMKQISKDDVNAILKAQAGRQVTGTLSPPAE